MHDRAKPPLPATDHHAARIADALLASPHIAFASAAPGDDTVRFTSVAGLDYTLTLREAEPTDDDILPARVLTDAVAAAILNHPDFYVARPDFPREDTITVQTRSGIRHLLILGTDPGGGPDHDPTPSAPATDLAATADRLLTGDPSDTDRATADLLHHVAATWNKQDEPLRQYARTLARTLTRQ